MSSEAPITILIVEDSPTASQLLLFQLETGLTRSFTTIQAETLAEAQHCLRTRTIDLVLLDLNLPDSSGLDTFNGLQDRFRHVPIVVLSGITEESIAVEAVRSGAQDYLVKTSLDGNQSLNRSIQFSLERSRRMTVENELTAAQRVQKSLYPSAAPIVTGFDIAGRAFPAEKVSGDYYDYIPMANNLLGIVVGDVSGHGLGPALRMAETRASLNSLARAWEGLADLARTAGNLCDILRRTNAVLNSAMTGQFVSLFFLKLDPATFRFTYAAAGHRGFLLRTDGTHIELPSTGPLLGLFPDIVITESDPIKLGPGDRLFIPTDGIEESQSTDRQLFGKERMLEVITSCTGSSSQDTVAAVCASARDFTGDKPQQDDMTAVLIHAQ